MKLTKIFPLFLFIYLTISISQVYCTAYTWVGDTEDWNTATNWNPNGIPGVNDEVTIDNPTGTIELHTATIINSLDISVPINIAGSGSLQINGTFDWSEAEIRIPVTIPAGGTLNILDGGPGFGIGSTLYSTLTLEGTTNFSGQLFLQENGIVINKSTLFSWTGGTFYTSHVSSSIRNTTTGIMDISTDINMDFLTMTLQNAVSGSAGSTFINDGEITRSGGSEHLTFSGCDFTNNGTFNHNSGPKLAFTDGAFIQNGVLNLNAGTETLETANPTVNTTFAVPVGRQWNTDMATIATAMTIDGTLNFDSPGFGVDKIEGAGNITINGTFNWADGFVNVPMTIESDAIFNKLDVLFQGYLDNTLTLKGTTNLLGSIWLLGNGIVNNEGMFNWTSGDFNPRTITSTIHNKATGVINIDKEGNPVAGVKVGTFINDGTVTRSSGGGELKFREINFINNGTFNFNSGATLIFNDGFTQNGELNLYPNTVEVQTNGLILDALTIMPRGMRWIANGNSTINIGFNVPAQTRFRFNGGTMDGTGIITVQGVFEWCTGTLEIQLQTINGGSVVLSCGGSIAINQPFCNNGIIEGVGNINFGNSFVQKGIIGPGNSPGSLTLNKLDNSNGTIRLEIQDNSGAGTGHDELNISGENTLGGTLEILLLNDFVPAENDSYTLINCTQGCNGTFSTVNLPSALNGWGIFYNANNVELKKLQGLAIDLLDFSATTVDDHILLQWTTQATQNIAYFELQRYANQKEDWQTIYQVNAKNSSPTLDAYSFIDKSPAPTNIYRVKIVETSDESSFSNLITVNYQSQVDYNLTPNPAQDNVQIRISAKQTHPANLQIFNTMGKMIYQKNWLMTEGVQQFNINTSTWANGIYFIEIRNGAKVMKQQLVVHK